MEDSTDSDQLIREINDHGFTVKPIEADENGVIIDGNTRMGALRNWELDLIQAGLDLVQDSAADRATQPADQEPQPDLSGTDSQVVNHECTRCIQEKIIVRATHVVVGGCIEHQHVNTRWLCDRHWGLLKKGCFDSNRMPYCMICYENGDTTTHWADYLVKTL